MTENRKNSVVYRIDSEVNISFTNQEWAAFAIENNTPELAVNVEGTWLWKHVTGATVVDLNKSIVAHVRRSGRCASYSFRCDAPGKRRDMRMSIRPLPDSGIEFESWIVFETPRQPILFLDHRVERNDAHISMCAWCRKVKLAEWVEVDAAVLENDWFSQPVLPSISHGICPDCMAKFSAELEGYAEDTNLIGH